MKYSWLIRSVLLIFILRGFHLFSQGNNDCLKYKTGKFIVQEQSEQGITTIIKRTKRFQIEKNNTVKSKDRIIWLSDCEYKLIPVRVKDKKKRINKHSVYYFKIIETGEDYYKVLVKDSHTGNSAIATMIEI